MQEPQAFLNGRWLPASQLSLSVVDAGFVLGAAVSEQLRTFGGRLFHLDDHLARLEHSLAIVGIAPGFSRAALAAAAEQLVAHNHALLAPGDDLGLSMFVTPGTYPSYAPPGPIAPVVCLHTYPLPFGLWAEKYASGQALATTDTLQVPERCWPASLKCRSRMHYYLADRQAAAQCPGARALLLDDAGLVTEASTANVVVYRRAEGLIAPPDTKILHGISLSVTFALAAELGVAVRQRELSPADVLAADEALLTSTPLCLLPATRLNGQPIGDGRPGKLFAQLLSAWNRLVGIDIVAQARQFAQREG